jgi:hypothetical protein
MNRLIGLLVLLPACHACGQNSNPIFITANGLAVMSDGGTPKTTAEELDEAIELIENAYPGAISIAKDATLTIVPTVFECAGGEVCAGVYYPGVHEMFIMRDPAYGATICRTAFIHEYFHHILTMFDKDVPGDAHADPAIWSKDGLVNTVLLQCYEHFEN